MSPGSLLAQTLSSPICRARVNEVTQSTFKTGCKTPPGLLLLWGGRHLVLVTAHRIPVAGIFVAAHGLSSCGCDLWDLCSLTRDPTHIPCMARWIL